MFRTGNRPWWYCSPEFAVTACAGRDCMAPGSPVDIVWKPNGKLQVGCQTWSCGSPRSVAALWCATAQILTVRQKLELKKLIADHLVKHAVGFPQLPLRRFPLFDALPPKLYLFFHLFPTLIHQAVGISSD